MQMIFFFHIKIIYLTIQLLIKMELSCESYIIFLIDDH